ncbi:MAG: extracellular solute-binding protein [Clostridia bacterium]|nr:extracellular solute-binding protein [Clostridia bacterium]
MNKMKKAVVTAVAALMAFSNVAAFSGCSNPDDGKLTVTFYHTMGKNLQDVLNKYIPAFNAMYPDVKIVHDTMGDYPALRDQISTEILGGNSPSIAYCYPDHVALYNKSKKVITLDDYMASTKEITLADGTKTIQGFTQAQLDDFVDVYLQEGTVYGDGKMYTLPFTKSTEVMYYNKTFFEENKLEVPKTWDEMETLCAQIKELTYRKQYDADGNEVKDEKGNTKYFSDIPLGYDSEANWFITMTEQLGTPYTSATGEHFIFNTKENRDFVKRFRGWYENGYVMTEEIFGGYTSDLFTETDVNKQKCYMCIGSSAGASYQCPDLENKTVIDPETGEEVEKSVYPFEVGIAQIPQMNVEAPKVIQQGPALCIFKKANQAEMDAAWAFAKFLTTNVELQAEISMTNGYTPVIESVKDNSVYANFLASADGNAFLQASSVKQTMAQSSAYYISPAFDGSSAARDQVGVLLQNCFLKTPAANQSVDAFIEAEFNSIIDTLKYDFGY